jgi:hypothetical protein
MPEAKSEVREEQFELASRARRNGCTTRTQKVAQNLFHLTAGGIRTISELGPVRRVRLTELGGAFKMCPITDHARDTPHASRGGGELPVFGSNPQN